MYQMKLLINSDISHKFKFDLLIDYNKETLSIVSDCLTERLC
jgi:hypothetical protein